MNKLILLGLLLISFLAHADPGAKQLLDGKMSGMKVSQMGMCDGMRTTLVVYRSDDGKVAHEFVGYSGARYVVVQEGGDGQVAKKSYFTKRNQDVVLNDTPMDWGVPLTRDGPNFFFFHFFPDRQNDCGLSQPMK